MFCLIKDFRSAQQHFLLVNESPESQKWRHSESLRRTRLCRCSYFTSSPEPTETLTWKFNVSVWMCCVEPPSPCRLFTTASFPCLSPAFSALPWQQKCWNKTFHHTHGSRRADGLHLNLEIRGNCSLLGAPFNVRVQKNVKRSHLMCETLSDSESERRPSLGAFWKLLWLLWKNMSIVQQNNIIRQILCCLIWPLLTADGQVAEQISSISWCLNKVTVDDATEARSWWYQLSSPSNSWLI